MALDNTTATVGTAYAGVLTVTCDPAWVAGNGYKIDVLLTGNSDGFTMTEVDGITTNIGGIPAVAGVCTVTCNITDSSGNTVTCTPIDITVSAGVVRSKTPIATPQVLAVKPK